MAPHPEPTDQTLTRRRRLTGVAVLASASLLTTGGVALAGSGSGERPSLAAASHDLSRDGVHGTVSAVGRSEEHTSELQSLMRISYAVFCLKKTKQSIYTTER